MELSKNTHPLALHIYIHVAEQSNEMAKRSGIDAANALSMLSGDASANHLLHMPGHIYLRTGLYSECIASALKAIKMDSLYQQNCLSPYADLHDKAMLIAGALFSGDKHIALDHSFSVFNTLHNFAVYQSALFPTPKELILAQRRGEIRAHVSVASDHQLQRNARFAQRLLQGIDMQANGPGGIVVDTWHDVGSARRSCYAVGDRYGRHFDGSFEIRCAIVDAGQNMTVQVDHLRATPSAAPSCRRHLPCRKKRPQTLR